MDPLPLRDYRTWHDAYDRPGSPLHLRLLVVQDLIAEALDRLPPGPVRVISMCAGEGRDILTVARRHRRGPDLTGRLVELDPANAAAARAAAAAAGLAGIEVVEGDAGRTDAYPGAAPADLVLACGIFGNVSRADIERTVRFLPALCAAGARVIWTRHPRDQGLLDRVRGWFAEAGFADQVVVVPDGGLHFGVGACRFAGTPVPLPPGERIFTFQR